MSQIEICGACGARIEIEDSDILEPIVDSLPNEDENLQEVIVCESCAHHNVLNKT